MPVRRWGAGLGGAAVLVVTGAWVLWPASVDDRLWGEVRPVIEARLAADARGDGYGETVPGLRARWFCRAEAVDLDERDGIVRAGVTTLCMEYGERGGALVECGGSQYPQVVRLKRESDGGYRVVSREAPPDGEGYSQWEKAHFSSFTESGLDDPISDTPLKAAARTHFGLPADAGVTDC